MHLSLKYAKGRGMPSYFPLSAITDRCNARNQLIGIYPGKKSAYIVVRQSKGAQEIGL
jgi:hypothetical protein